MLIRIVRHELRTLASEPTLWIALAAFTVLTAYGTVNGVRWATAEAEAVAAVTAAEETRFAGLRERLVGIESGAESPGEPFRDPTRPATVGRSLGERRAVLPVAPLAGLSIGQSDLLPSVVPVTTRSRHGMPGREEIANPLHLLTGRLDLAFVTLFLLPLLILAISYDMLSREREGGTLGLLLSQPIRLGTVVTGKVLARAAVVLAVAIPVPLAVLALAGAAPLGPGATGDFLLWTLAVAVYSAFWLALAAAINVFGRSSAQQAVALSAIWLLFAVVVPSALTFGGRFLYPVPSRAEMIGAEREAARIAEADGNSLLARNYEDHPELAPEGAAAFDDVMTTGYAVQEAIEALMAPVREHYDRQIAGQQALVSSLRVLSPVLLAQRALDDIAGTGEHRHKVFLTQVEELRGAFHDYFRPLIYRQEPFTAKNVDAIPVWTYREESARARSARVGGAIAGILIPTLLLVGLTIRGLGGYTRRG